MENNKGKTAKANSMDEVSIEKVIVNVGAIGDELDKGIKLLKLITGKEPVKTKAKKRIPAFNTRPGLEIGGMVTIRDEAKMDLLKKLLAAIGNKLKDKQIADNHFSFGIAEYIEIPDIEYQRDIGIIGLDVTVVFSKKGRRVNLRRQKVGRFNKITSKLEIIKFMEEKFNTKIE